MRIGMSVTAALQAGFALAATIARDSGAKRAQIGLAPDVSDAWCGLARDLERLSKAERRERIRTLTRRQQAPRPAATATSAAGNMPPESPSAFGSQSRNSGVPAPRPGYTAPPMLSALLARIGTNIPAESPSAFGPNTPPESPSAFGRPGSA
jgi:hypothetical protein